MKRFAWLVTTALPLAGCAVTGGSSTGSQHSIGTDNQMPDAGSGSASLPVLTFAADWSVTQSAPVISGGQAIIDYDLSRLPQCRTEYMGEPAWDILVSWATDGGDAQSTSVTQQQGTTRVSVPTTIVVAQGNNLAIWFYASDESGCQAYDSDYGQNFNFALAANACVAAGGTCFATHGGTCASGNYGANGLGCPGAGDASEACCLP